jgi:hypothetical protein
MKFLKGLKAMKRAKLKIQLLDMKSMEILV